MFYYNTYVINLFPTEISKFIYTFITHPFTESRYELLLSIKHNEKIISDDVIMIFKDLKMNQMQFPSMDYAHMTYEERYEFDSYHLEIDKLYNQELTYRDELSFSSNLVIMPRHCHRLSKIIKDAYSIDTENQEIYDEYLSLYNCYYANEKILFIINQDMWV